MPDSDLATFLRLLRATIDDYLAQVDARAPVGMVAPSADGTAGGATAKAAVPSSSSTGSGAGRFEEVRSVMIRELVDRTGYPEEMLELDLDLEGELGIDTVKQVAVLGAVREHFALAIDPAFKLREQNTLRKAISYVAARLDNATVPARG